MEECYQNDPFHEVLRECTAKKLVCNSLCIRLITTFKYSIDILSFPPLVNEQKLEADVKQIGNGVS